MLFRAQDEEINYSGPGSLLYYKEIPVCLLANQYTSLGIINGARIIVHGVVLYLNSKVTSFWIIKTNELEVNLSMSKSYKECMLNKNSEKKST